MASATLARIGATWSVSTWGWGLGVNARRAAAASWRVVIAVERVGHERAVGLLGAGDPGQAPVGAADEDLERLGGVLERLALEEAGEEQVALLEAEQLVVELESRRRRGAGGGS